MGETSKTRERVLKFLERPILDLGCRDDKISPDAIGIDMWDGPGINIVGDASNLKWFQRNSINTIFSSHLLEHITFQEQTIKEWCRVLRPNGRLILYLPDPNLYHYDHNNHSVKNPEHIYEPTLDEVVKFINKAMPCSFDHIQTYGPPNFKEEYSYLIISQKLI